MNEYLGHVADVRVVVADVGLVLGTGTAAAADTSLQDLLVKQESSKTKGGRMNGNEKEGIRV